MLPLLLLCAMHLAGDLRLTRLIRDQTGMVLLNDDLVGGGLLMMLLLLLLSLVRWMMMCRMAELLLVLCCVVCTVLRFVIHYCHGPIGRLELVRQV